MSLRPSLATAVPEETAKVARAAFPRGCRLMDVRDSLGPVFDDARFARLFSTRGRPAEVPWRLALITLLQFAENLSDRDAADAVRARLDWKYLLALPLDDPGFDSTVLCEFRARLVDGHAEHECWTRFSPWPSPAAWFARWAVNAPTPPTFWPPSRCAAVSTPLPKRSGRH